MFNIIFAGTPEFAAVILKELLQTKHIVKAVYTQPDRPAGRGRHLTASPVKTLALEHHLPVLQPQTLRDINEQEKLREYHADLMIVVAYGLILPQSILTIPRLGCINVHASLLPRFRGAAPIQRAILSGDVTTGVTIMQMDAGLDTGPMLQKAECNIAATDTSKEVHDKLALLGAETLLTTLDALEKNIIQPTLQDNSKATYAAKIKKEEGLLDWQTSAEECERKIRAFNPWPVAYFIFKDQTIRVFDANVIERNLTAKPGTVLTITADGIEIATAKNSLQIRKLQLPGGRVLTANEFLNARKDFFRAGEVLGN
ncbi:methionyl-tRNA formyltransferase [Gammaproteobacteria bacterium SCGC AG-212-F23]|nr:methionyl-tRNA formyltransferase [Gammaproteobacteria bacterium SCGC AG-212-F23]